MKPLIIAHRGNNFSFPENSLNGLRSSFELGCMAVEFDMQMMAETVKSEYLIIDQAGVSQVALHIVEAIAGQK